MSAKTVTNASWPEKHFSSTPTAVTCDRSMPSTNFLALCLTRRHMRFASSCMRAAAADTAISLHMAMIMDSMERVKCEWGRAHGTSALLTPQSGQSVRGIRAWMYRRLDTTSRLLQALSGVRSCIRHMRPHCGQGIQLPGGTSTRRWSSSSPLAFGSLQNSVAFQGGTSPRCSPIISHTSIGRCTAFLPQIVSTQNEREPLTEFIIGANS